MYDNLEIANASVTMVEIGWMETSIVRDGKAHTLEFDTRETPNIGGFSYVDFATDESEDLAKEIGFEITEDFKSELYHIWQDYSNRHFR